MIQEKKLENEIEDQTTNRHFQFGLLSDWELIYCNLLHLFHPKTISEEIRRKVMIGVYKKEVYNNYL